MSGPSLRESISGNVRRIRLERGMSQEALAQALGVQVRRVQRIERQALNLTLERVEELAEALEVDVFELVKPARVPPPLPGGRPRKDQD